MNECMLNIQNASRSFRTGGMIFGKKIMAVDDLTINLPRDKPWITSIVGESGSGKTTLARMILGLLDMSAGQIEIDGKNITELKKEPKKFYSMVQPIFQNPFSAFSGRKTVDTYLYETALNLGGCKNKAEADELIEKTLKSVGLELSQVKGKYPNQFSGGELQRTSIARALIPRPRLIIADEPVAMIDASLRMNIVNLFKSLRDEYNLNFIYVTHDLSTAYYVSDYIATMYRGRLIEFGDAKSILYNPSHPYTELLLDSIPKVGQRWDKEVIMPDIETKEYGQAGCRFYGRCPYGRAECGEREIPAVEIETGHRVLCLKYTWEQDAL